MEREAPEHGGHDDGRPERRLSTPVQTVAARARAGDGPLTLALCGLLAGASLSLARLYDDGRWLLPTWLTIAAALLLGALMRRARLGSLLSLLAMAAGFVVVAGNLLFADTVFWGLPTPATVQAMLTATR